jgi:hypothetical protein
MPKSSRVNVQKEDRGFGTEKVNASAETQPKRFRGAEHRLSRSGFGDVPRPIDRILDLSHADLNISIVDGEFLNN